MAVPSQNGGSSDPRQVTRPGTSLLTGSLWAGAVYDVVFGVGILVAPGVVASLLGLPLPDDELYLRFLGVFLLGLAFFYILAAREPVRYRGVAAGAVLVRAMGCAFLAGAVLFFGRPSVFLLLGAADGLFALLHAAGLAGSRPHLETVRGTGA